jgi:hypothetical protein
MIELKRFGGALNGYPFASLLKAALSQDLCSVLCELNDRQHRASRCASFFFFKRKKIVSFHLNLPAA